MFNVGCGRETTLNELYRMIRLGMAGYDPSIARERPTYGVDRRGDIRRSMADISAIKEHLKYESTFSTAQGLGQTVKWYIERLAVTSVANEGATAVA